MAREFACQLPPRSPVLVRYGEAFPDFIAGFPPAGSVPYLADMARLELMCVQAYHAADALAVSREALCGLMADPDRLPGLRMILHPSIRILRAKFAVVSLWVAHQGRMSISGLDPLVAESALIYRRGIEVEVVPLDAGSAAFIEYLMAGERLGDAVERVAQQHDKFDLSATLSLLIQAQLITRFFAHFPEET
jgi:hypothetical protein